MTCKYRAVLRDTVTGRTAEESGEFPHGVETLIFYWTEGNMGCDCNRGGIVFGDLDAVPCNADRQRIALTELWADGGKVIEDDVVL